MRKFLNGARLGLVAVLGISALGFSLGSAPAPMPTFEDPAPAPAAKGTVTGTVTLADGKPAAAIVVRFTVKKGSQVGDGNLSIGPAGSDPLPMGPGKGADRTVGTARTNAEGIYTFEIEPGSYKLIVANTAQSGTASAGVEPGKVTTVNIQMKIKEKKSGGGGSGTGGGK